MVLRDEIAVELGDGTSDSFALRFVVPDRGRLFDLLPFPRTVTRLTMF
jgi:hypothetical protein